VERVVQPEILERPHLLDQLDSVGVGQLCVMTAAAGYGKSTLLAQWVRRSAELVAFVEAAPAITVEGFGHLLTDALLHALPDCDEVAELHRRAHSSAPDWPLALMPRTLELLSHQSLTLVIDDVHHLDSPTCELLRALAGSVVRQSPARTRLILAGRSAPVIGLARATMLGDVVRITEESLVVTTEELAAWTTDVSAARRVLDVTGGWPAGLRLGRVAGLIERQDASDAAAWTVSNYLDEEIFSALAVEDLWFLEQVAAIAPINAELCDIVLDRADSERRMRTLAAGTVPMLRISPPPTTLHMHGLLSDELLASLARRDGNAAITLKALAAEACEARGLVDDAYRYLAAIGDLDLLAAFFYRHAGDLALNGRQQRVRGWLEPIPEREAKRRPGIAHAWMSVVTADGDVKGMQIWMEQLNALGGSELPDQATASDSVARFGRLMGTTPFDDNFTPDEATRDPTWRAVERLFQGWNDHLHDRTDAATSNLLALAASLPRWATLEANRLAILAMIKAHRNEWQHGAEFNQLAEACVRDHEITDQPMLFLVDAMSARYAARRGDLAAAAAHASRARTKMAGVGDSAITRRTAMLIELAEVYLDLDDAGTAGVLLNEAAAILSSWTTPTLLLRRLEVVRERIRLRPATTTPTASLSSAELRVLRYLPSHYTLPQIAELLFVAPSTVRTHTLAIYRKLEVGSRTEAVAAARRAGLVDL
jgi:LuxR family maltose regulon positive regulatory protein